ncbi:VaFE repeat-containing surface-anchored protein [Enterococcus avium]|uniref:VaFE repeat-containing surface-anchored protein n=1 Tax=Enterococcus avium TaxID=33945 RepID=UPI001F5A39A8|nr:VaFE repeat-containing surface-anchored protein [Enterococcus avium]
MNKLKKIAASLMLLFTLSGQLAPSVQVFAEEATKTELSSTVTESKEEKESKETKASQTEETTESTVANEEQDVGQPEIGESQNSNDSPKVEEKTDVNEQLAKVLKDYGYYMTTDGQFLSSTNESVRDNWSEFLSKVQELRSESQMAKRALSIVPYAGLSIFVDQNYSIPTVSWDYSNGIHEQGFYAKRDAAGGLLWCVAPGNPLNFGENGGYTTEELNQQNLVIASLIAYWGYETQPSVENAFYTEHHIQNMGTGVVTSNIQDPSGRVSQAGFEAWIKETNRKINSYLTKPSFNNNSYTMKKGETLRIDDTNSSLWAYKVATNSTNLSVSTDGNTLVLKAVGDVKDGSIQLEYNVPESYKGATLVYRHPYSQELLHCSISDPNITRLNVKIQREGKLLLKKVDDTGKAIAGAEFNLTANGKTTKATTNSNGELATSDYNVGTVVQFEETKAPAGHYIDSASSKGSVTLKEGTNTIKVTNPRFANLTLVKKNDKGKNLEGVTFKLNYGNKDYTVKTDKDGQIKVTNTLKNNDKVSYEEVATLKGHYIDPETSKGEITVKSGENTLNINNPTLNFGMASQAGNTDREQFINPAKDQELVDEVMIEAHQAPANAKLRLTTDFVEFGTGEQLGETSLKQSTEFEAEQARFVKAVALNFDATNLHGKKGVFTNVLEYFNPSTQEWEEVARHDDLNNEDEAIQIVEPKIHTEFFFYDQNGNESKLSDPLAKVKGYDRVHYENLISGKEYKFDLALMNKDGKTPFTNPDGKEVTGTLTVVAGKDGVVTSKVDAKEYYENLAKEEAEKEDSKEETQGKEESDVKSLSEEGQEETTDEEKAPEVQTEFSEVKPVELLTGYVDVLFEANLSVANGKVVVAYEQLSTNETPIAEHKDPDSEEQTGKIRNPEISTKAMVNGEKQVTTDGKIRFDDIVEYKDLTPGIEYEMEMTIMVKDENAPLKLQDKEVTGKAKFTPEKENGETTVTVEFDAKELFSKYGDSVDLVAFEKTTTNGEVIAVHEDINDSGQTVKINKPVVPAKTTKTTLPQTAGMLTNPYVLIAALALVAGAIFLFKNRKEGQEK